MKNFFYFVILLISGTLLLSCSNTLNDKEQPLESFLNQGESALTIDLITPAIKKAQERVAITLDSFIVVSATIKLIDPDCRTYSFNWSLGDSTNFTYKANKSGYYTLVIKQLDELNHSLSLTNKFYMKRDHKYKIGIRLGGNIYMTQLPVSESMILYLPLSNNTLDHSGYYNNGMAANAGYSRNRFNDEGASYWCNRQLSNSIIISNLCTNTSQISLTHSFCAWINTTNNYSTATGCLFSSVNTTNGWYIAIQSNKLLVAGNNGGGWNYSTGTKTLNDGKWHFIVVLFDSGNNYYAYIDNVLDKSGALHYSIPVYASTSLVSMQMSAPSNYYSGALDDVRLYNRKLTLKDLDGLFHERSWDY